MWLSHCDTLWHKKCHIVTQEEVEVDVKIFVTKVFLKVSQKICLKVPPPRPPPKKEEKKRFAWESPQNIAWVMVETVLDKKH